MIPLRSIALALLVFALAACQSGSDQRYLDASLGQKLELPPDLSLDDAESRFELPANFAGDDPNQRNRVPVLAKVDSLRLEGSANLYWLSVEEPVDNLYQQIKNFWAVEGYRLVIDEPVIGIMQTEWIYRDEGTTEASGGWFARLAGEDGLSSTQDQFKTRIERGADGKSRVYIAHRGTQYLYVLDTGDGAKKLVEEDKAVPETTAGQEDREESQWRFRQPEPELEIEMLSRLMIYLGLQQEEVERQVAEARLFKPRAFLNRDSDENTPFVLIKDTYHIAWNRVYHSLERMNFEIANSQFNSGLGFGDTGYITVNTEIVEEEEDGGFFSFFSSKKQVGRQFVLVLSPESHEWTRMNIETEEGEFDTSPEGAEFLTLLFEQIR